MTRRSSHYLVWRVVFLTASILVLAAGACIASTSISVFQRAESLDKQSVSELNVHLWALCLLLQSDSYNGSSFFRKDALIRDGSLSQLETLEKNGYVRLTSTFGPPDGLSPHPEVIMVKLTDKGKGVVETLKETARK